MKKILVISTSLTGMGHKSASDSLKSNLSNYRDLKVKVVEGFELGDEVYKKKSSIYKDSVKISPEFWHFLWIINDKLYKIVNNYVETKITKKFLELINDFKPDLIVSVQPIFVGSTINILEKNHVKIPFGVCITDIATISNFWMDERADFTICTTKNTVDACIKKGLEKHKLCMLSYPLKSQFLNIIKFGKEAIIDKKFIKVLMIAGGDGTTNFKFLCREIINWYENKYKDKFQLEITIILGNNNKLSVQLERNLSGKYKRYINIKGFVKNIEKYYLESTIGIFRASPGIMLEAVACNLPMILIDYIPGQESGNGKFAQEHNIGIMCMTTDNIIDSVEKMICDDFSYLKYIKSKQRNFARIYLKGNNIGDYLYKYR